MFYLHPISLLYLTATYRSLTKPVDLLQNLAINIHKILYKRRVGCHAAYA